MLSTTHRSRPITLYASKRRRNRIRRLFDDLRNWGGSHPLNRRSALLVVSVQDLGRDTAAIGHLHALLAGPLANGLVLLPIRRRGTSSRLNPSRTTRPPLATTGTASTGDEVGERVTELARIVRRKVDLIGDAVQAEADGLLCPGTVQVIDPRASRVTNGTLSALGLEPVDVGGRSATGTHYSLVVGAVRRDFWVDASGRLLRVEIPSAQLVAAREELPR